MSIEFKDQREAQDSINKDVEIIDELGNETKDHQEDLEGLYEKLEYLMDCEGLYSGSDTRLVENVEMAIEARETDIEECKEKIEETKEEIEYKVDYLQEGISKTEERCGQMKDLVSNLNYSQEGVINNINIEIINQEAEIQDANEKKDGLEQIIRLAEGIIVGGAAAEVIGDYLGQITSVFG